MDLPVVYHPDYAPTWPRHHRFPMSKFKLLHDYLIEEGVVQANQVYQPEHVSMDSLRRVHDAIYLQQFMTGSWPEKVQRRIGLGWKQELVTRTFAEVGGTVATVKLALKFGLACNTAGGTHHAFPDFGSGFCVINDLAVAARVALHKGWAKRIAIIDLDVHQGDGTAFIFREEPRVFTFSMHGAKNFPFRKQQSDWDISLDNGTGDDEYLTTLEPALRDLFDRHLPDLVLYDAGADVHENDKLGKLAMTSDGMFARDTMVIKACIARGIPVACVIGGGYSDDRPDLAPRHAILHRAADKLFKEYFRGAFPR